MEIINEKYNIMSFGSLEEIFLNVPNDYFIITDENVYGFYKAWIDKYNHFVIRPGEDNKTLDTVNVIYQHLLYNGYNRNSKLLGIGGGIVTDITGYVASTYMRGVKFGFIPTTLLAMVDASLGGKNGVNYNNYKNIIGCFNQPSFIYICKDFLNTLEEREYNAGYGEILKYAIGFRSDLYEDLKKANIDIDLVIRKCISTKMDIVDKDEHESGLRKKLNLGHTIAHAIEKQTHDYMHGEAVYIGLVLITKYAYNHGILAVREYNKIMSLLDKFQICDYNNLDINIQYISKDKKTLDNDHIDIIIPVTLGTCNIRTVETSKFIDDVEKIK